MSIKIMFIYNLPNVVFFREVWEQARSQGFPPEGNEAGLEVISLIQCYVNVESLASFKLKLFTINCSLRIRNTANGAICGSFRHAARSQRNRLLHLRKREPNVRTCQIIIIFNNFICLLCLDTLSDRNIGIKVSLVIKSC